MKIVKKIKIEKNLSDIFNLPCVVGIRKQKIPTKVIVFFSPTCNGCEERDAFSGESLVQYDNGQWDVCYDR